MRRCHGQVATALNLFIGLFIVGALAIFAFEMSRIMLAREQLKACVDIAALAGEATLLSSTQSFSTAQLNAKQTALNMFRRNSILGTPMTSVTEVSSPTSLTPSSGDAKVFFEFIDPVTSAVGGPNSNVLRVTGAYSYQIFGGSVYGMGDTVYTVAVGTKATLPALDMYVLMDLSASMDDQTPVTWMLRKWDPAGNGGVGAPTYSIPVTTPPSSGLIFSQSCPNILGSPQNSLPPQHLEASQSNYAVPCEKCFSEIENVLTPTNTKFLRGVTETNVPGDAPPADGGLGPGGLTVCPPQTVPEYQTSYKFRRKEIDKYDPLKLISDSQKSLLKSSTAKVLKHNFPQPTMLDSPAIAGGPPQNYPACTFTHLVVNIDGNNLFSGTSVFGYSFPGAGSLVEASVGNLESPAAANTAKLDLAALGVAPSPGYRDAYRIAAASKIEPLYSVQKAVDGFLTKVRYTADPHFGFVAFSTIAGQNPGDTFTDYNVSWAYPQGGMANYPLPGIQVDPGNDNFAAVQSVINVPTAVGPSTSLMCVQGGTNVAQAMSSCLLRLDPNSASATTRDGAARAVVLVTDGVPSYDLAGTGYPPAANGPALTDARSQAAAAKAAGIPVFVVVVSQNPALDPELDAIYSDTTAGGIAYDSGNGAKYYRVPWTNPTQTKRDLDAVFGNITRQLVSLVR
jgi:hypothetical protein